MTRTKHKLIVLSIVNYLCAEEPRTKAVRRILDYHGYEHIQFIDPLWFGLASKPLYFTKVCREMGAFTHILLMDARDVVLLAGPDEVMERWYEFGHPWVFNAEPFLFPPGLFEPDDYAPCDTPYRYLNGGVALGEQKHIANWFDKWAKSAKDLKPKANDQVWWVERFLEGYPDAAILDAHCELFQCMCGSQLGEDPFVQVSPGRVHNRVTDTDPLIIHYNGGTDITAEEHRGLWEHWI